jgi:hypothetical protein
MVAQSAKTVSPYKPSLPERKRNAASFFSMTKGH